MEDIAGWVALVATTLAAIMTASNLGSRVTGWGFVVFTIGAVAWVIVGALSGQPKLLVSNAFLLIVDLVGVWRWLGRQAKFDDAARAASDQSARADTPKLFSAARIAGMAVNDTAGNTVAHAVDAMTQCRGGRIAYLIVRMGGIGGVGEELRRLPWDRATIGDAAIATDLASRDFERLPHAEAA